MTRTVFDEEAELADIVERLQARFPHTPRHVIEARVAEARDHFARARVRDFVPVLIEREARARLANPI